METRNFRTSQQASSQDWSVGGPTVARGGLTVNAAFLQEIKDDNRHLRDLRIALRKLTDGRLNSREHMSRLVILLNEFRDQLAFHFALEEAFGYFDGAVDIAPRLSTVAEELRSQHSTLFQELVDIADVADEAVFRHAPPEKVDAILQRYRRFDQQLTNHEEDEANLMQEAVDRDIGGEG